MQLVLLLPMILVTAVTEPLGGIGGIIVRFQLGLPLLGSCYTAAMVVKNGIERTKFPLEINFDTKPKMSKGTLSKKSRLTRGDQFKATVEPIRS